MLPLKWRLVRYANSFIGGSVLTGSPRTHLPPPVLQELQGADAPAGREPSGLQRGLQGEAGEEEGAQPEDHPSGRGGHRPGPAEQGADGAVAQGQGRPALD